MPYLPESEISFRAFESAKIANANELQTRIFMPRFGVINERRHQLHEVIRLSGVNLIIDDIDVPLVIKVASIPKERMQVYFIDNDDFFKRKAIYKDEKNKLFADNDERMIFFTKGVISTVKKLNWAPDVIMLHGWISSLIPLYLKTHFKTDALFKESVIVTSLYDDEFEGQLSKNLVKKITFDDIEKENMKIIQESTFINLQKLAVDYSDYIIYGSENISKEIKEYVSSQEKPSMNYCAPEDMEKVYNEFFQQEFINISN